MAKNQVENFEWVTSAVRKSFEYKLFSNGDTEVAVEPCGNCENEARYVLFNEKSQSFYPYVYCSQCEAERQQEKRAAKKAAETEAADDLTTIKGLGAASEAKLNAAGIKTYAQLAAVDEVYLYETVGFPKRTKVGEWIAVAQNLMAGQESE